MERASLNPRKLAEDLRSRTSLALIVTSRYIGRSKSWKTKDGNGSPRFAPSFQANESITCTANGTKVKYPGAPVLSGGNAAAKHARLIIGSDPTARKSHGTPDAPRGNSIEPPVLGATTSGRFTLVIEAEKIISFARGISV